MITMCEQINSNVVIVAEFFLAAFNTCVDSNYQVISKSLDHHHVKTSKDFVLISARSDQGKVKIRFSE